jgi:AcrR family transcriptional regulator
MQRRSRQTVDAVLDAVVRILKREGVEHVTTNRIAEVAGVSIGSVYQYFPDKRAIFAALHDRHAEDMGRRVEALLVLHADASLEHLVRAIVDGLIDAHASDPELYELLSAEVPHAPGERSLESRLRSALRLAIMARADSRRAPQDLERRAVWNRVRFPDKSEGKSAPAREGSTRLTSAEGVHARRLRRPSREGVLFVLPHLIEALSHAAAVRRPPRVSLAAAREAAMQAISAYLRVARLK